jgi:hypothetical protein
MFPFPWCSSASTPSMTAYTLGLDTPVDQRGGRVDSAGAPVTVDIPIDGSNL